ncbi:hypothetical protein [Amycolatopsis alkalitolerans]|uniref:Uncharacterized protein n=1 Tax=Amycolatopsis alkalitolerans TaxID=2547244 RepID=A0A5C4LRM3_9PSEU|nr:hypothetical protein [Amycolatopsis alkalitolerans]TNC21073.1 hypothetical protein FG385_29230 [Amycolatopsis alkalitolerans]
MSDVTSAPTVFGLVDEILRPLARAVPGPGELVRIDADPLGRVQAAEVARLREPAPAGHWIRWAVRRHLEPACR